MPAFFCGFFGTLPTGHTPVYLTPVPHAPRRTRSQGTPPSRDGFVGRGAAVVAAGAAAHCPPDRAHAAGGRALQHTRQPPAPLRSRRPQRGRTITPLMPRGWLWPRTEPGGPAERSAGTRLIAPCVGIGRAASKPRVCGGRAAGRCGERSFARGCAHHCLAGDLDHSERLLYPFPHHVALGLGEEGGNPAPPPISVVSGLAGTILSLPVQLLASRRTLTPRPWTPAVMAIAPHQCHSCPQLSGKQDSTGDLCAWGWL